MIGILMRIATWRFRRTTLILVGCVAVLLGLALARKVAFPTSYLLVLILPFVYKLRRKNSTALVAAVLIGLSIGWWRGSAYLQQLHELTSLMGKKVTIQAVVQTDAVYGDKGQLEFDVAKLKLFDGHDLRPLVGTLKVTTFELPFAYRGDTVTVNSKLLPMRGSRQGLMGFSKVTITEKGNDLFATIRRDFAAGMQNALPEPAASLGLGLLIGQRSTLPAEVLVALTTVGLVHIVAVSGYNVTILARAVQRLKLSRSKYQQLILSLLLIGGFVLITGFSASVVRAAVVSLLSLWAWYYGRQIRPVLLIFFTAAVTGLGKPLYIWSDIGWYLSFLAFFGVLVIAPLFAAKAMRLKKPGAFVMLLLETLAAELMTLPLLLATFGQLSLVSVVANILVVPLVPIAMLLSAVAATAGVIMPAFAGWLSWPAILVLTYMLDIVQLLSNLPLASVKVRLSTTDMLLLYAVVAATALVMTKRTKYQLKRLKQPEPNYNS